MRSTYELDEESNLVLTIYLYKNVTNLEEIKKHIMDGTWQCSVINPQLILHPLQVAVAANMAAVAHRAGHMVTRTPYSELIFNLSLSGNISKSLSKFGISNNTDILIAFLETPDRVGDHNDILLKVKGELCPILELNQFSDKDKILKEYQLLKHPFDGVEDILDVIVTKIVTRVTS